MNEEHAGWVAKLAERYGRMVFGTAYRIFGCPEDAEDVLQEVFLKVLRSWDLRLRPDTVRDWGAYLRVMASRSALDLLRRKTKWKTDGNELIEEIPATADNNPRHSAIQNEQAILLRRALTALPKRDARVFALRYFEDLSYEEIAGQTGLNVNAVGVALHRARQRLREILEPIVAHDGRREEKRENHTDAEKENSHVAI